jgi:translation initiation factor 1
MSKKRNTYTGIVYSTDPNFSYQTESNEAEVTLAPAEQKLTVKIDTKKRAGKKVTLITGFIGTASDLEDLGKQLKTKCGAGGSAKDSEILIQGDYRDKVIGFLKAWGYGVK